jgi:hypothetical protein
MPVPAGVSWSLKKTTGSKAWASANVFPLWGWALYCGTAYFLSLDAKQAQILRNERQKQNSSEVQKYRALEIGKNKILILWYTKHERDSSFGRISRQFHPHPRGQVIMHLIWVKVKRL